MADYSPKVYRQQGATEMVVSSGGLVSIEDGGLLNVEAGGGLQIGGAAFITTGGDVALGSFTTGAVSFPAAVTAVGALSMSSGIFLPILTASSGTVVLPTYGVSVIYSSGTGTGPASFTMAAAAAGQLKGIVAGNDCTSTAPAVVTFSNTLINGRTTVTFSTGKTNQQYIWLVAQNSTNWVVVGLSTNATIA